MRLGFFCSILFLASLSFAQDLSGLWQTRRGGGYYAELNLVNEGNGRYSGTSYDEQGGGYCNYQLRGTYDKNRNVFRATNTYVISKSPSHTGSSYNLRYKKDDFYEYLVGNVQILNSFGSSPIPVTYYRPIQDPIIAREKQETKKEEEEIPEIEEEPEVSYENSPLPIPEPESIPEPERIPEPEEEKPVVVEKPEEPEQPQVSEKPVEKPQVVVEQKPKPEAYEEETLKTLKEERTEEVVATYNLGNRRRIKLKIRDYGEEDNDIISVFLDDKVVIKNHVITRDGEEFEISFAPGVEHKLTFVANNLGEVPPNTCTVSFVFGNKSYYKRLFTDETKNAVIILKP